MSLIETFFCYFNQPCKKIVIAFFILIITSCDANDVSDLKQYVIQIKAKPKGILPSLPTIKAVEPFIFNPKGLRDPFQAVEIAPEAYNQGLIRASIQFNKTRKKEILEKYPLVLLSMVGTLSKNKTKWALIRTTDGIIHRVKKGNYLGHNFGEILRISEDKIELLEIILDSSGGWREKPASLVMTD